MKNTLLLWPEVILGAEEPPETPPGDPQDSGDESGSGDPDDSNEDPEDDPDSLEDVVKLRQALTRERELRKQREREANEVRRKADKAREEAELAEKSELEAANTRLQQASELNEQLMSSIKRDRVNAAILAAAAKHKFIDSDDALTQVNRSDIEITEDDDEFFIINPASVESAVKALATKKPHLVRVGTDDGDPSGSGFNSKRGKQGPTTDDELRKKYSALNN